MGGGDACPSISTKRYLDRELPDPKPGGSTSSTSGSSDRLIWVRSGVSVQVRVIGIAGAPTCHI